MRISYLLLIYLGLLFANSIKAQVPAQTVPAFTFYKLNQSSFTEKDLPNNKFLFFVFFDPTCEHCQQAIQQIGKDYAPFKKAAVYLISMDDGSKINQFMNTYGTKLKGQPNLLILQDKLKQFILRFKPVKYPSMFLYNGNKKLIDYQDNPDALFRFTKPLSGK